MCEVVQAEETAGTRLSAGPAVSTSSRSSVMRDILFRCSSCAWQIPLFPLWTKERISKELMTLSELERDRIREEKLIRLQARVEMKRRQRPRLFSLMVVWTLALTLLVAISAHLR